MYPPRPPQRLRSLCRLISTWLIGGGTALTALPTHAVELPTVEVIGEKFPGEALVNSGSDGDTVYRLNQEGMAVYGSLGGTNPYALIANLPGVNAQSPDPYDMANVPGGNKGLRIRGEASGHGSIGTVDGLPLSGINPGPGYQWMFDEENIGAVTLRQGPIAPDRFAFFTTGGAMDSEIRGPLATAHIQASQAFGSNDFTRSFVRGDTGQLSDGSALFLSASRTSADKWRGPGQSPSYRDNVEAGWSRPLGDKGFMKLTYVYNDMKGNNYRPLTYNQAKDLNQWRSYDYSTTSSNVASQAVNYYQYNRQEFTNWAFLGEFSYALSDKTQVSVKPYYLNEKGQYFDGMANGKIRNWLIDHEWYGFTAEVATKLADTGLKLGYWFESSDPPGPPTAWKMYNPTASGGLGTASWAILADTTQRHLFNSVYALADHQFGQLKVEAGARYVEETLPAINEYNTAGIGNVSYSTALSQSKGIIANRSVSSFDIGEFLPFLALTYPLHPNLDMKASLGRTYGAPAFDVWPVFQQNSATFLAKGLTADKLWHKLKAETGDALDLGLNWHTDKGYVAPTVFYSRNHDKNVTYDPGVGVSYAQNVGDTRTTGAQLASGWSPRPDLDLFASTTYTHTVFVKGLPLLNGSTLDVVGKQLPDTPRWQASLGGTWKTPMASGQFSLSPVVRYVGSRYGDTQGTQKVDGYFTADLSVGYQQKLGLGKLNASLSVQNLFDKQYIGFINTSYYQATSGTNAYYYPGAPRTVMAKVGYDF